VFSGASYTDLNAVIPAKDHLVVHLADLCGGVLRGGVPAQPAAAVDRDRAAGALECADRCGVAGCVGTVRGPAEREHREAIPIQRNIDATRTAFWLTPDKIKYVDYSGARMPLPAQVGADTATISNLRLLTRAGCPRPSPSSSSGRTSTASPNS